MASAGLALGRGGAGLRASLSVHTVAEAGGERVYVLQNDGAAIWHRARLWLDDRRYAEQLEIAPGEAWRITEGELMDLHTAPLAHADPFYVGLVPAPASGGAGLPRPIPTLARLVVGPDALEIRGAEITTGESSTP